jgi:hypothetical protein
VELFEVERFLGERNGSDSSPACHRPRSVADPRPVAPRASPEPGAGALHAGRGALPFTDSPQGAGASVELGTSAGARSTDTCGAAKRTHARSAKEKAGAAEEKGSHSWAARMPPEPPRSQVAAGGGHRRQPLQRRSPARETRGDGERPRILLRCGRRGRSGSRTARAGSRKKVLETGVPRAVSECCGRAPGGPRGQDG